MPYLTRIHEQQDPEFKEARDRMKLFIAFYTATSIRRSQISLSGQTGCPTTWCFSSSLSWPSTGSSLG